VVRLPVTAASATAVSATTFEVPVVGAAASADNAGLVDCAAGAVVAVLFLAVLLLVALFFAVLFFVVGLDDALFPAPEPFFVADLFAGVVVFAGLLLAVLLLAVPLLALLLLALLFAVLFLAAAFFVSVLVSAISCPPCSVHAATCAAGGRSPGCECCQGSTLCRATATTCRGRTRSASGIR
jgi:hypothetical protein